MSVEQGSGSTGVGGFVAGGLPGQGPLRARSGPKFPGCSQPTSCGANAAKRRRPGDRPKNPRKHKQRLRSLVCCSVIWIPRASNGRGEGVIVGERRPGHDRRDQDRRAREAPEGQIQRSDRHAPGGARLRPRERDRRRLRRDGRCGPRGFLL